MGLAQPPQVSDAFVLRAEGLTMDRPLLSLLVNESPLAQSMPNKAQMSPANTSSTSYTEKQNTGCHMEPQG